MVPSVQGEHESRAALATEPCQHCAVVLMALSALQHLSPAIFWIILYLLFPERPTYPSLCQQHGLCRQAPLLSYGHTASPALHSKSSSWLVLLFFGVKLKQAIKEKLCCPIYTNQWSDLASIAELTKLWDKIQRWKMFGLHHHPAEPSPLPAAFQPHSSFLSKDSRSWRRREEGKVEWEANSGDTWGCERPGDLPEHWLGNQPKEQSENETARRGNCTYGLGSSVYHLQYYHRERIM